MPERIAVILHALHTLLGFGRHMAETAPQRAADPRFSTIAVCFGTARLPAILAHLHRGILRAMALEHVLLARATTGRDVAFAAPRGLATRQPPADPPQAADPGVAPDQPRPGNAPAECRAAQSADPHAAAGTAQPAAASGVPKPPRQPSRPTGWDDPELFMPTLEELIAQVRRRPIGRTLVDICLDLGAVPGFCTGPFWTTLFDYRCSAAEKIQMRR